MNYRKALPGIFFLALLCLLGARTLSAQEEPQQPQEPWDNTKPKPAGQSNPYFDLNNLFGNAGDLQPDYTPLTGMLRTPDGILVIPDGSRVTSIFACPASRCPSAGNIATYGVDFQFPGGTGGNRGNFIDGDASSITFTVPVTNLSLTALWVVFFGLLQASDGADTVFLFECGGLTNNPS